MKNRTLILFLCSLLLFCGVNYAQIVTHGPFVAAVTDKSARAYVRTDTVTAFSIILSADSSGFTNPLLFNGITNPVEDTTALVHLTGLQPDTKYFYKVIIDSVDASTVRSFRTFPVVGTVSDFTFAFGSCQEQMALPIVEPVFDKISLAQPRFMLQTGDWGYPDTTDDLPNDNNFFSKYYTNVQASYRLKYSHQNMNALMQKIPVDYIYDDHDFMNDNSARDSTAYYTGSTLQEIPNPPGARGNSIRGYVNNFPTYNLADALDGIYHSFRYGNIEVFMCDDRSARSPELECFIPASFNTVKFDPPPGHSILGKLQMDWLINGLKASTARWKFIVSGVVFNKGYKKALDYALNPVLQNVFIPIVGTTGKALAVTMADTWNGYPDDQGRLINECYNNNISNVIFLTADSHTSAIDDGANAGFPEMMSGNLNHSNSHLAEIMWTLGLNLWNGGGQGISNLNFSNAFGKIDVFGNDSVGLCIIDESGASIACITVKDGVLPVPVASAEIISNKASPGFDIYPNPVGEYAIFSLKSPPKTGTYSAIEVYNCLGEIIKTVNFLPDSPVEQMVDLHHISSGFYYCVLNSNAGIITKKLIKI